MTISNFDKLQLLLWKNWCSQMHRKCQLIVQVLVPVIFSFIVVVIRTRFTPEFKETYIDSGLPIDNLDLLRTAMETRVLANPLKYHLAYSPYNAVYDKIVKEAAVSLELGYSAYANAVTLEDALVKENYLAGVEFADSTANIVNYPEKLSYRLRFPSEQRTVPSTTHTWFTNILFSMNTVGSSNDSEEEHQAPDYMKEGFITVQNAISMAFIKQSGTDLAKSLPKVFLRRYPQPAHIDDQLHYYLSFLLDIILVLSFGLLSMFTVKHIVAEKEKQLKEIMKIMGLPNWLHWMAWFVKALLTMGFSSLLKTIVLKMRWKDNVAVLTYSSFTVVLFFFLVFAVVSITLCFMLAAFFTKASTAATTTGLVFFVTHVPYHYLHEHYSSLTTATKIVSSLVSNTAIGFAIEIIVVYESNGEGLQWSNLFTPVSVDDQLAMGHVLCMMIVASILQMSICLYVEQIYPGEFGVPKAWNYPFSWTYWCGNKDYAEIGESSSKRVLPDVFEAEPEHKSVGVHVRNLSKSYGDLKAVKNMTLNMYKGEITVLLGPNGAGKTTTVSILTGMIPPTSGTAIVNGCDIRTNMDGARMSLSICAQNNILFDDMTVKDHLIFYSRLKGFGEDKIKHEVTRFIKKINLEGKANELSSTLSGGMKRKLSICAALCGGTKVVVFDEPSAGLDPAARRQLWDLLQSEKVGRTILLTTNMMDEAEVLGDRIAIMFGGELKCLGTAFFLKKMFGCNYRLICEKMSNCDSAQVTRLLDKYIPGIQPEADTGTELYYEVHDSYSNRFESMFRDLESHSKELAIEGYGISITSLEEVFMKVGIELPRAGRTSQIIRRTSLPDDEVFNNSENMFSYHQRLLKGSKLTVNQWRSMILKKYLFTLRNKIIFAVQNIMPIVYITTTLNENAFPQLKPITFDLTQYPTTVTVLETSPQVQIGSVEAKISANYKAIISSYGVDHRLEKSDSRSFADYILDLMEEMKVRVNARYIAAATINDGSITAWLSNNPIHSAPLTVNLVHNAMARTVIGPRASIVVTNAPLPSSRESNFERLYSGHNLGTHFALQFCTSMTVVSALYVIFIIRERQSRAKLLQFVGGVQASTFWLSHFIWDLLTYTLTVLISILTLAYFQEEGYSTSEELGRYLLVLMLFASSVLPFTYLMAYRFPEAPVGYGMLCLINFFFGYILFVIMIVVGPKPDAKPNLTEKIFLVAPHYALSRALNKLFFNSETWKMCKPLINTTPDATRCKDLPQCCTLTPFLGWKPPGVLLEMTYLIGTTVVFLLVLISKEYRVMDVIWAFIKERKGRFPPSSTSDDGYVDDDVELEKERVQNMSAEEISMQNLVLDRMTKFYGESVAVNQISVAVERSECFGLLGINGAGKTTTFKMLTGDERISSGEAYVKGFGLKRGMSNVYQEIGYCPQFEALFGDFTGRETLEIFSLLRGVPEEKIPRVSLELAMYFDFLRYYDKKVASYSGGHKRKLSIAIAVLGCPSVVYLDEPTTGMDPVARRQFWNMVCRIRDAGTTIFLTTHSMEECEALCTRLAIMVNGEFKCIGSTQHLRNKFTKGLILKIKIKKDNDLTRNFSDYTSDEEKAVPMLMPMRMHVTDTDVRRIMNLIKSEFPDAFLQDRFQTILTFNIPLTSIPWSRIFGLIERNKARLNIEDYSISQTTLEEIFLQFAQYQRDDPREGIVS